MIVILIKEEGRDLVELYLYYDMWRVVKECCLFVAFIILCIIVCFSLHVLCRFIILWFSLYVKIPF